MLRTEVYLEAHRKKKEDINPLLLKKLCDITFIPNMSLHFLIVMGDETSLIGNHGRTKVIAARNWKKQEKMK